MKTKKSEETKRKLLKTAVDMFNEKGYYNTKTKEITDTVGVSHATFFVYFKTKESVLIEAFKISDEYVSEIFESVEGIDDYKDKLIKYIYNLFSYYAENMSIELTSVVYGAQIQFNNAKPFLINKDRASYKCIRKIVADGIEKGFFVINDIEKLTDIIVCCVRGVIFDWLLNKGNYDLSEKSEEILSALLDGISAK